MIWRWHDMGTAALIRSTTIAGWRQTGWERVEIQQIRARPKHPEAPWSRPLGSNHSPASMVPPVSLLYVPLPFRTDFWLRV